MPVRRRHTTWIVEHDEEGKKEREREKDISCRDWVHLLLGLLTITNPAGSTGPPDVWFVTSASSNFGAWASEVYRLSFFFFLLLSSYRFFSITGCVGLTNLWLDDRENPLWRSVSREVVRWGGDLISSCPSGCCVRNRALQLWVGFFVNWFYFCDGIHQFSVGYDFFKEIRLHWHDVSFVSFRFLTCLKLAGGQPLTGFATQFMSPSCKKCDTSWHDVSVRVLSGLNLSKNSRWSAVNRCCDTM